MTRKGKRGPYPRTILSRIADHVKPSGACLLWTGSTSRGRPHMQMGSTVDGSRRPRKVHQIVWVEHRGPIPPDYDVHHTCQNILCVNIEHLALLPHGCHSSLHLGLLTHEQRTERSRHAMHARWHVNRGHHSDACDYCTGDSS